MPEVTNDDLQSFVLAAVKRYPTVAPPRVVGDKLWTITVPRVLQDKLRQPMFEPATFDPHTALGNEKADFLAFGHPLVDVLIGECQDPDFGTRATIRYLDAPDLAGFEGLQVVYTVEYSGIRPIQRLRCVVVNRSGVSDSTLSDRIMRALDREGPISSSVHAALPAPPPDVQRSTRIKTIWEDDEAVASVDPDAHTLSSTELTHGAGKFGEDLDAIHDCRVVADEVLFQRIEQERLAIEAENERIFNDEMQKLTRIHQYRYSKAAQELREHEEAIERFEAAADPDTRRIIPVYRGRAESARQAMADLDREHKDRLEDLMARRNVSYGSTIEAVAVVYGP